MAIVSWKNVKIVQTSTNDNALEWFRWGSYENLKAEGDIPSARAQLLVLSSGRLLELSLAWTSCAEGNSVQPTQRHAISSSSFADTRMTSCDWSIASLRKRALSMSLAISPCLPALPRPGLSAKRRRPSAIIFWIVARSPCSAAARARSRNLHRLSSVWPGHHQRILQECPPMPGATWLFSVSVASEWRWVSHPACWP